MGAWAPTNTRTNKYQYNVRVSSSNYAKYYFHLRSMCAKLGLRGGVGEECSPLNVEHALKIQVVSSEFKNKGEGIFNPQTDGGGGDGGHRRRNTVAGEEEFDKLEGMHKEGYQLTGQKQPPLALEQIVAPHQTKTDGQQL